MKKLVLIMVSLFLISSAYAQDKEALKAQKEAEKEAKATFKKAKSIYETSIPNKEYGREVTDFEKLAGALPLIESAIQNEYTNKDFETWKVATDIMNEYYQKESNELKDDPENEQKRAKLLETSLKLVNYCPKYDDLLALDTKTKPEEKTKIHLNNQIVTINPALQVLNAAQNASNSDNQAELKKGVEYADLFLNIMEKSNLMKDFKNDKVDLDYYKTYAKVFRAQSLLNIEGTPEADVVAAYEALIPTKSKAIAYNSLSNYFSQKDKVKQNKYLVEGIEALKDDAERQDLRANFAFIYAQNLYNGGNYKAEDKESLKKAIQLIKDEFSDNDMAMNAYQMEGQIALNDKKYKEAIDLFLAASEKYPDEEKFLILAAGSAWENAKNNGSKKPDLEEAIKLFKQVEKACPTEPEFWGESLYILYNNTQQTALANQYKKYYKGK
jgi:hypothetical protein